ncbi:MAG: hypothetical protein KAS07_05525 [Candidatus Pacebacteria bacterium]|nr:hypothetical protein [Candidatus Paceibacterota bacterium]
MCSKEISNHIKQVSHTLIKSGDEIDWLKERNKLSLYKKGLQEWLKQIRKYLKQANLTSIEISIIAGEKKRIQYKLKDVSARLQNM